MDSAAQQTEARVANEIDSALVPKRRNGIRVVFFVFIVAVLAIGAVDLARAWNTKRLLSNAAIDAARIVVSTPLASHTCADLAPDHPPCSIESAADSVKSSLMKSGLAQASCITPNSASFSGVLVWVFSCDGDTSCSPKKSSVCLKLDMTALQVERNQTLTPSARVTVLYPHSWVLGSALKHFPGGSNFPLPASLAGSALLRFPG
jgi:hypothetical protein